TEESAALRQVLLKHKVEPADQQRGEENAGHPAEAAEGDHDQEVDQILERIWGIEAEEFGTEPAAERRHAAAERERDREQTADIDAERLGHPPVVDCGADLRAHAGALEAEPQGEHDR